MKKLAFMLALAATVGCYAQGWKCNACKATWAGPAEPDGNCCGHPILVKIGEQLAQSNAVTAIATPRKSRLARVPASDDKKPVADSIDSALVFGAIEPSDATDISASVTNGERTQAQAVKLVSAYNYVKVALETDALDSSDAVNLRADLRGGSSPEYVERIAIGYVDVKDAEEDSVLTKTDATGLRAELRGSSPLAVSRIVRTYRDIEDYKKFDIIEDFDRDILRNSLSMTKDTVAATNALYEYNKLHLTTLIQGRSPKTTMKILEIRKQLLDKTVAPIKESRSIIAPN